jgi:hypothetical protein
VRALDRPLIVLRMCCGSESNFAAASSCRRFDIPAAYREARRILKPGGAFAAWTYAGMEACARRCLPPEPATCRCRLPLPPAVLTNDDLPCMLLH